jgi:ribosomal protein L11 methyltransferase
LTPHTPGGEERRVQAEHDWVAVRVDVDDAMADAVTNFLVEGGAAGVLTDDARQPDGRSRVVLEAHVRSADQADLVTGLRAYLRSLAAIDPAHTAGPVEIVAVPPVDWEGVFRAHHTPLAIGRRLVIAPPWDVPDAPGRELLVIDPGMAFGTGQHATTRTCLEEIEAVVESRPVSSGLDVGTGTGVLAAAMSRLGVPTVVALDVDEAVLPLARAMLDANRASAVQVLAGPVGAVRGTFDLVVANILADTLVAEASDLVMHVATGGSLVLSGILEDQVARVAAAMTGFAIVTTRAEGPWRTLRLERERLA